MTKKRFTFEFDNYNGRLFDNNYQTFYHIEDSEENIELLCSRLNALHEENEQLKQLVNIADDLIDKLGSETMQNEWIKNF